MNIIDYIIIGILILSALKGFKQGLLPSIVNFVGVFLIFIIAFYIKQPISILLYENFPFLSFAGIFKGIIGINILFYEVIAYGITITILGIIFTIIKRISIVLQKLLNVTLLLNLPGKIIGAFIGLLEGILFSFILIYIGSVINSTTSYINNSKLSGIILEKTPIINNVTSDLTKSYNEIYDSIINNKNNTNKANLETIDILMKYDILSYKSATKLYNDNKLKINGVENIIEKYRS